MELPREQIERLRRTAALPGPAGARAAAQLTKLLEACRRPTAEFVPVVL